LLKSVRRTVILTMVVKIQPAPKAVKKEQDSEGAAHFKLFTCTNLLKIC
jgi:hypothetical protein